MLKSPLFLLPVIIFLVVLNSCKPDIKENGAALKYFDLKGFLTRDTAVLNRAYHQVDKTVIHNGVSERRNVKIYNWGQELNLFFQSDINKPAWKNSYTIINNDEFILYKAKYPELQTRELLVKLDKQKVKWILIYTRDQNFLYKTNSKLTYYPDSAYLIEKLQHVRLLGNNTYIINGLISH